MLAETFLILWRTEQDIINNVYWSSLKVHFSLSDFNELEYRDRFFKNPQKSNFMKILLVVAIFFFVRTDRWTDMSKLTVVFLNFAKAPKNSYNPSVIHILCS
jgi:flagellar biosynthesis protein FlhB